MQWFHSISKNVAGDLLAVRYFWLWKGKNRTFAIYKIKIEQYGSLKIDDVVVFES